VPESLQSLLQTYFRQHNPGLLHILQVGAFRCSFFMPGCSFLVPFPDDYPLIADKVKFASGSNNQALTFAVTGERRFVIISPDSQGHLRVCAEPSPDLARTVTSQRQGGAGAQLGDVKGFEGASGSINYRSYYSTAALLLTQRSQGLQLYRDGMYYYR
jgi:hypothetical protein